MSAPNISILLQTPIAGFTFKFITTSVSLDTSPEITEAIEAPAEVNRFVAPDISLRVYDDPKTPWARALFAQITPTSTNWYVLVSCDGYTRFRGYILPNTVQIDDQEQWVSFTALGMAGLLSTVSADLSSLKRTVDAGWRVVETAGNQFFATITIDNTGGSKATCEIESGDSVTLTQANGQESDVRVLGAEPVGETSPYAQFQLTVVDMNQQYEAGTVVTLATPYRRNVKIKDAVDALYAAVGLAPTVDGVTYLVAPISGAGAPFASPLGTDGLIGNRLGLARNAHASAPSVRGYWPVIGTDSGLYEQQMPPQGTWAIVPGSPSGALRPVDWTPNGNGSFLLYGKRYVKRFTRSGGLGTPPDGAEYKFYAYVYTPTSPPATAYRYVLTVTVDNIYNEGTEWNWTSEVSREKSTDYKTWTADVFGPWGGASGVTTSRLHDEIPATCGIDILGLGAVADRVYWTAPTSATGTVVYGLSEMDTSGFAVVSPLISGVRGAVVATTGVDLVVFQRDEFRGNIPTAYKFSWSPGPGLALNGSAPVPADVQPYTVKLNAGDSYYYGLSASKEKGVYLLSGIDGALSARSGWVPPQLYPPTPALGVVDMTIFRGNWSGSGPYPMAALFGNQAWYIAFDYSGVIPYLDLEGLSCGDALAQLATLEDAFFYVDREITTWFKARSVASGQTIGTGRTITSARIDDDGCISFRRAGIWYKAVRYVKVVNERDETVFGEAGDADFIGNELAIEISNRFVYPASFASALAQHIYAYLGRPLIAVDVEHTDDGRDYSIGNTFDASVAGIVKTFQIIEATHRPAAGTVRVQGVEL